MHSLKAEKTLVERVYDTVLDAICEGVLKPGERLTQDDIAKRLDVSRQPITSALLSLKSQGFVQDTGRRGLVVAPIDAVRFRAIYELRSAIDPLAVRLAAAHVNDKAISRIQAILEKGRSLAKKKDSRGLIQADMDFHFWFYDLCENSLILEAMRLNWRHLQRAMGEVLRHPGESTLVWNEHAAIAEALLNGKIERAAKMMEEHAANAGSRILPLLTVKPEKTVLKTAI